MKFGLGLVLVLFIIAVGLICGYSDLFRVRRDYCLGLIRGCVVCGFIFELLDIVFIDKFR